MGSLERDCLMSVEKIRVNNTLRNVWFAALLLAAACAPIPGSEPGITDVRPTITVPADPAEEGAAGNPPDDLDPIETEGEEASPVPLPTETPQTEPEAEATRIPSEIVGLDVVAEQYQLSGEQVNAIIIYLQELGLASDQNFIVVSPQLAYLGAADYGESTYGTGDAVVFDTAAGEYQIVSAILFDGKDGININQGGAISHNLTDGEGNLATLSTAPLFWEAVDGSGKFIFAPNILDGESVPLSYLEVLENLAEAQGIEYWQVIKNLDGSISAVDLDTGDIFATFAPETLTWLAPEVEATSAFPVVDRGDGESISRLASTEVPNPADVWFRPAYIISTITKGGFPEAVDTSLFASEADFKVAAEANGINVAGTSWILNPNEGDVGPVADKRLYTVAKVVGYGEATNKSATMTMDVIYVQMYGVDENGNPFSFVQELPFDNTTCQNLNGVAEGSPSYQVFGSRGDCSVDRFAQEDANFIAAGYYLGNNGITYDIDSVKIPSSAPHAAATQDFVDALMVGANFDQNTETGALPLADVIVLE